MRRDSGRQARPRFARDHVSSIGASSRERVTWTLLALPLLLLLAVPIVLLVGRASPGAIARELTDGETRDAIVLSLVTSVISLGVTILLGTPLALYLARTRSRLGSILETFVDLPTVLPPSVAGVALLLALGRTSVLGGWLHGRGLDIAFTPLAVVVTQVFVASPYFVRSARAGFASVPRDMLEASIIDGATGWTLLTRVIGPLSIRSLGAGAAMSWSRALGEFGATMIFAGSLPGVTRTMPIAVYVGFESSLELAIVLSTILIALSLMLLVVARAIGWRESMGQAR